MEIAPSERRALATAPRMLLRGAFPVSCALLLLFAGLLPAANADEAGITFDNGTPTIQPGPLEPLVGEFTNYQPAADEAVDDDNDEDDGSSQGQFLALGGCLLKMCLNATPDVIGEHGEIAIDGSSVAVGGDGGDGASILSLGVGVCLIATCDLVGANNGIGGKGGKASAEDGNGHVVATGGDGGDGGLIAIGIGVCALGILAPVTCDDVGSSNGIGGDGGRADATGGTGEGTGVGTGGDAGDAGPIAIGIGVCAIGILAPIMCDDVGSNNGRAGDGGLGSVFGGSGNGAGVSEGGMGGDGGIGLGVGICAIGILSPLVCNDVGSDTARGGEGGKGVVDGIGDDSSVSIGGNGGNGGIGASIGICALNIIVSTPCDDVGSNTARGGHGGAAVTSGVGTGGKKGDDGGKDGGGKKDDGGKDDGGKKDDDGTKPGDGGGKKDDGNGKGGGGGKHALAETGQASVPLALMALVALLLGAGLVGAARRFDRRNSLTSR